MFHHLAPGRLLRPPAAAVVIISIAAVCGAFQTAEPDPQTLNRFVGPTSSQPLALSANGTLLLVANPDNNTVTLFDVTRDRNRRLGEVPVGREPNGVAVNPQGTRGYVANTVSGTVTVLALNRLSAQPARVLADIPVGTEPYGLALTPNGSKLYVSNARSNSVSVIDTRTNRVIRTINNVGFEPRGLAITNDLDNEDDDETVFVTQFLALPLGAKLDGEDDSKIGLVTRIRVVSDQVDSTSAVLPLADSGFKAAGDAIARTAPPATITEADLRFTTGAYPNQLNNIAVRGNFAYIPNTGASPNGPVRFDVNTQSLLSVINLNDFKDAGQTINMHSAVARQTATPKLFVTQPWAMAIENRSDEGYVVSAASDVVVKVRLDRTTGAPEVINAPGTPTRVLQIATGKNPRGIVINSLDTRAYIMNYVSRDVTVIDLTAEPERSMATLRSSALPEPGTGEDLIHIGKELYNSSTGTFDAPNPFAGPIRNRMSNNGWGSCASCHPNGLSDNVVWIFAAGPRRTVSQHIDYDPSDPNVQRVFNWSGIFDEQEDFELNIRGVSGGQGLLVGEDGTTPDNPVAGFTPANAGRRQLKVRGQGAWDAIKAYIQFGVRAPISPLSKEDPDVIAGEALFRQAGCQQCHGGPLWTSSRVTFTPPPGAGVLTNGQVGSDLRKVGTFDTATRTEVRANAAAPLGNDGFIPPSLLSLHAFPKTFFHNGQADSLEAVMNNVTHRSAGSNGIDLLAGEDQRRQLIRFILSIDAATTPIE